MTFVASSNGSLFVDFAFRLMRDRPLSHFHLFTRVCILRTGVSLFMDGEDECNEFTCAL